MKVKDYGCAVFTALTALAVTAAVTACTGTSVSKAPAAPPSVFTPAPLPAESAAPVTTGPLGTSFKVTTTDDSGNPVSYTVTAVKVDQHAGLAPYETLTSPADHMAAVRFTVTGVTGQESDDANSVATVTGSDTTEYPFSASSVGDGPNFNGGDFEVGPGQSVSGWVAFELPPGVSPVTVAWQPGLDSSAATWTLGS